MTRGGPGTSRLPAPLDQDTYRHWRKGVYDDPDLDVYVNEAGDFAFLDPLPTMDYKKYQRRAQKLGLENRAKRVHGYKARLEKVAGLLENRTALLEIGAADGAFLELVHQRHPDKILHAIEPDTDSRAARDGLAWLIQHENLPAAAADGVKVDLVGMFHVFEHLVDPSEILSALPAILAPGGVVVIEVPCLLDPLLSIYNCPDYQMFYFQRQHPYTYTAGSLQRVLEHAGFTVESAMHHQRYGLDNHLQWLTAGKPGGNAALEALFGDLDEGYRRTMEGNETADTVFIVARPEGKP